MLKHPIIKIALSFVAFFVFLTLTMISLASGIFGNHGNMISSILFATGVTFGVAAVISVTQLMIWVMDYNA